MPIANNTEDDILYAAGDPGDPATLEKGCFCTGDCLQPGVVLRFFSQTEEVARTPPLESSEVLVIVERDWQDYKVKILSQQPDPSLLSSPQIGTKVVA